MNNSTDPMELCLSSYALKPKAKMDAWLVTFINLPNIKV